MTYCFSNLSHYNELTGYFIFRVALIVFRKLRFTAVTAHFITSKGYWFWKALDAFDAMGQWCYGTYGDSFPTALGCKIRLLINKNCMQELYYYCNLSCIISSNNPGKGNDQFFLTFCGNEIPVVTSYYIMHNDKPITEWGFNPILQLVVWWALIHHDYVREGLPLDSPWMQSWMTS